MSSRGHVARCNGKGPALPGELSCESGCMARLRLSDRRVGWGRGPSNAAVLVLPPYLSVTQGREGFCSFCMACSCGLGQTDSCKVLASEIT